MCYLARFLRRRPCAGNRLPFAHRFCHVHESQMSPLPSPAQLPGRRLEPEGGIIPSWSRATRPPVTAKYVATRPAVPRFQVVPYNHGADEQAREVETMEPRDGRPITYILPTTASASLLDVIVREAAGAVIATYTEAMRALSEQALARRACRCRGRPAARS